MKILVTGFDPFGGETVNPAIETVKRLPDSVAGAEIIKLEIPTVCHKSLRVIDEAIAEYDPDVVLSIGQAGGRPDITVERIGINMDDCRIPDNEGNQIIDEPVFPEGRLPILPRFPSRPWYREFRTGKSRPPSLTRREPLCATMCSTECAI